MASPERDATEGLGQSASSMVAGMLAMSAFLVAVIAGLSAGATPLNTLSRATTAMLVCYFVGLFLGVAGSSACREFLTKFRDDNPIPEVPELPQEVTHHLGDDK
ncbi:MAG: hypothetical protein CMJ31_04270 [Phycisphaerae bacterium]|nr:hypothetical protein [Phycisphaerae bacterium]